MPDLVSLSLWLRGFEEQTMLGFWRQAIEEFPVSSPALGVRSLAIYPLNWSETPVVEQASGEGISAEETLQLAHDFLHADFAYEAQMNWDLWMPKAQELSGGWERRVQVVSIICLGSEFDPEGQDDRGYLQINFGPESNFLPAEEWALTPEEKKRLIVGPQVRENVEKLVSYARRLEKKLPVARRRLWCESGENLAEKILSFWNLKALESKE